MWSEIVAAAVVGSERQALKAANSADALGNFIAHLDRSERDRNLLAAAAAAALYWRAGRLPGQDERPLPEACAQDELPRCSPRAGEHLRSMLSGLYPELLPEWLESLRIAGERVQEESLPSLLDFGLRRSEVRGALLSVLGERGKWLIAQTTDWKEYFSGADGSVWEDGSSEQRRVFLEFERKRDPARARRLLAGVWEQESPKNRADFLQKLAAGLGLEDEPFLERALDDGSAAVRRTAADLLSRLPESAFVWRMRERAKEIVSFRPGARGRTEIEIALPEERDERMVRDAIVKVPPHSQIGEKAWWMQQIISAVPPRFWREYSACSVEELLKIAGRSEWSRVLLNGWSRAAIGFGEIEWIECLLELSSDHLPAAELFASLPPERQEVSAARLLSKAAFRSSLDQWYWCLKSCRHRWSEGFSLVVVRELSQDLELYALGNDLVARQFFTMIASHLHPAVIPEAIQRMNGAAPLLKNFRSMMQFRHEMLAEFKSPESEEESGVRSPESGVRSGVGSPYN